MTTPVLEQAPPHPVREFWSYFSANKGAVAGLAIVVLVLLVALFAPLLAPHAPDLTNNAVFRLGTALTYMCKKNTAEIVEKTSTNACAACK